MAPNPLPGEFIEALWRIPLRRQEKQAFNKPFTQEWLDLWGKIAEKYPGSQKYYGNFVKEDGINFLEQVAKKGANANFILKILVKYAWNENVAHREHTTPNVKKWHKILKSAQMDREKAKQMYGRVFPQLAEKIESALGRIVIEVQRILEERDFSRAKRDTASDKKNRAIFTIYEHLKQRTGGPQWETFWDFLVAAKVIKGQGEKSNKDRQIQPHLGSFQKDNPLEAQFIRDHVIPQKS